MKRTVKFGTTLLLTLAMVFTVIPSMDGIGKADATTTSTTAVTTKTYSKSAGKYSAKVKQSKVGERTIRVTLPGVKPLKKVKNRKKKTYRVKIYATMYNGKTATQRVSKTVKLSKISSKSKAVSMKVPALGKYTVTVKYYNKKGKRLKTVTLKNTGVIAKEYNIAVVNGSYGPLLLSLSLWDVTKNQDGGTIPTCIAYSRPSSYDWTKMPAGVYSNPLAKNPKSGNLKKKSEMMTKYVADLRSLNKNSKFHFYFADNYVYGILQMAAGNRIPESQYDVTLLSDGSGTAAYFDEMYSGEDASSVHNTACAEWKIMKKAYADGHRVDVSSMKYQNYGLGRYAYAAVDTASNVKWWIGSTAAFECKDENFKNTAIAKMDLKKMNEMLDTLKSRGLESKFKAWCHFDDSMFQVANKNHKKVMILMGGRVTREKDFAEFTKFVKKYYGNGYEYYYKGHPATPTGRYPAKQKQLKEAGVHDLESSIPAELILYFYPDVYVSGMSNSTMNYSYKDGRTCAYLGSRMEDALKKKNDGTLNVIAADKFQVFFSNLTEAEVQSGKVGEISLPKDHKCYLVEFNNNPKYDYAVYDYTMDEIIYHKIGKDANTQDVPSKGEKILTKGTAEDAQSNLVEGVPNQNDVENSETAEEN